MPGLTDLTAENLLNYLGRTIPMPSLASGIWLGLFTTPPTSNSGVTGATEVSGTGYARVQVAGALAAGASFTTGSANITMGATIPSWVVAGMTVYDLTNGQAIGTVSSGAGTTTLVLTGNAAHASSGGTDSLAFSAFGAPSASSGSEPNVTPANIANSAAITFPQATASWGTVEYFGLFDAATGGNFLIGDYLGAFTWQPCTISSASPGVFTCKGHGFSNGDPLAYTDKFGGTLPSFSQSNLTGVLNAANVTTDTFTVTNSATAVNTSSTGAGNVRKLVQQPLAANVTASYAAGQLTISMG